MVVISIRGFGFILVVAVLVMLPLATAPIRLGSPVRTRHIDDLPIVDARIRLAVPNRLDLVAVKSIHLLVG